MSATLLEDLSGLVTPELVGKAAAALGEQPHAIARGIEATAPLLLGSIAHRARDAGFASTLFGLVGSPANDPGVLRNPASLIAPGTSSSASALGGQLLSALFGTRLDATGGALADYAQVRRSTGGTLLALGAPVVLALLGKAVTSRKLDAAALAGLLGNQRQLFAAALPASLQKFDGFDDAAGAAAVPPAESSSARGSWFLPALLVAGAVLMLPYCSRKDDTTAATAPTAPVAVAPEPAAAPVEELPQAAATPVATLYFDVGKAELAADAGAVLEPVVSYVLANESAMAVVSGYHDPTGNVAANHELAKSRAMAVKAALTAAGIAEDRIEMRKPVVTEGGGSLEEARRVEVSVR